MIMNNHEAQMEDILRAAPRPTPPAGLKQKLLAEAPVAAMDSRAPVRCAKRETSWLRRWWPSLAPASISLACAAVITVQRMEIGDLNQSLQTLSAGSGSAESQPAAVANPAASRATPGESTAQLDEL